MLKKAIVSIVVVVAIIGIAFAAYGNTNTKTTNNPTNNTTSSVTQTNTNTNNSNTTSTAKTTTKTKISPTEAQKIASKYIEVSNATAGTPKLVNQSGTLVYIVPVVSSGTNVGEIDIDAQTGKNLGGAGGAP
jgi:uncharacterized membrane protein YkoI